MGITATESTVVAATYDQWAFRLETHGFGCARFGDVATPPISATVAFRKYRVRDDGVLEMSPFDSQSDLRVFDIPDLYGLAAQEPGIAAALGALVAAVGDYAGRQGWL